MAKKTYSIKALQTTYKSKKEDVNKLNEKEEEQETEVKSVSKEVLSIEEQMLKLYEEREQRVDEEYQNALYKNPPPLKDNEKRKVRWFNGKQLY